jgi:hypothetical protein
MALVSLFIGLKPNMGWAFWLGKSVLRVVFESIASPFYIFLPYIVLGNYLYFLYDEGKPRGWLDLLTGPVDRIMGKEVRKRKKNMMNSNTIMNMQTHMKIHA